MNSKKFEKILKFFPFLNVQILVRRGFLWILLKCSKRIQSEQKKQKDPKKTPYLLYFSSCFSMARPRKYHTQAQRVAAQKLAQKNRQKRTKGRFWRLVIPALQGYGQHPSRPHPGLESLKARACAKLRLKEAKRGLEGWCVAWQTHPTTGLPHLDILLKYSKAVLNPMTRYDYVIKHGNLTRYRTLNKAILEYGSKEDPHPVTNIDITHTLLQQAIKRDMYSAMESEMLKDPFKFQAKRWLHERDLYRAAAKTSLFKSLRMIEMRQKEICHEILHKKSGFRLITRELIEQNLSPGQLRRYDSWEGYQIIVSHINQIPTYGYKRPHKTPNLLIVGRPNTGKTTLCRKIRQMCATYPIGIKGGWWPCFHDQTYTLLDWQEFNLNVYSYSDLLILLEGQGTKLPVKGGHVMKTDNQLIIMTSNKALKSHIFDKFKESSDRQIAVTNLKPRITQVTIPDQHDLFMLLKLIIPKR